MTPADEARFIALWNASTEAAAIARQLGIPRGTVSSRAATLVRQGKIHPRPRGGAYPKQKALALATGITNHGWTVRELLSFHVSPPCWTPPKPRGRRSRALQRLIARWCP
jgi:hypothetical protein